MLDTLLFEPKRRRVYIGALLGVLVLAVGFVAAWTVWTGATLLLIFGIAFLAVAIWLVGKLLIVSHVHIRGTAGRVVALNDRYDETALWLEKFDADTRESFIATKRALGKIETGQGELQESVAGLTERSLPRAEFEKSRDELKEQLASLAAETAARADSADASVDKRLAGIAKELEEVGRLATRVEELVASVAESDELSSSRDEETKAELAKAIGRLESLLQESVGELNERITSVRDEHERKRKSASNAVRVEAQEALEAVAKRVTDSATIAERRIEQASRMSARQRGDGYVRFSRIVSPAVEKSFVDAGIEMTSTEFRYLERKLQVLEGLCEGRLAGSADDAVARVLAGRLAGTKDLRILEIGVLFGIGAIFLHHALSPWFNSVSLTLLDPFEGYYGKGHVDPLTGQPVTRRAVERNLQRSGVPMDDARFCEGFSHDDAIRKQTQEHGPFELIVIDGDHSADGIRQDFELYAEMLAPGGVLVIDDYRSDDWPAVTEFTDGTIRADGRFTEIAVVGKTVLFRYAERADGDAGQESSEDSTKGASKKSSAGKSKSASSKKSPAKKASSKKPTGKKSSAKKTAVKPAEAAGSSAGTDAKIDSKPEPKKPSKTRPSVESDADEPVPSVVVRKKRQARAASGASRSGSGGVSKRKS